MNYVTQLGFDLADAKAELASANSKISELENKLRAANAGLDWRESAKEKPIEGRLIVVCSKNGDYSARHANHHESTMWEHWTHWAYFNPPADPAEEAFSSYAKSVAAISVDYARPIFMAAWKAAKEAK